MCEIVNNPNDRLQKDISGVFLAHVMIVRERFATHAKIVELSVDFAAGDAQKMNGKRPLIHKMTYCLHCYSRTFLYFPPNLRHCVAFLVILSSLVF